MTLGIIDVGTNSIHLLIARVGRRARIRILRRERQPARLADAEFASGRLSRASMDQALRILRRYAATLKRLGAETVEAVATSAVRDAANGRQFVRRVRQATGLPLRMISGREEARLIYRGVAHPNRLMGTVRLVWIGGGSAQVVWGRGRTPECLASVPLGCARLKARWLRHNPPKEAELSALRRATAKAWRRLAQTMPQGRSRQVVAGSSMIGQLADVLRRRRHRAQPPVLTRRALEALVTRLACLPSARRLPGLDPSRQALALPTAVTLLAWMEVFGVQAVRYVEGSLREGLLAERTQRPGRGESKTAR